MDLVKDFFHIQKRAFKYSIKNPRYIIICALIIFAGVISTNIISNVLFGVLGLRGYLAGLIIYIFRIVVMGFLMSVLYKAVKDSKGSNLYNNDGISPFVIKIIQIGFVIYIAGFILRPLGARVYSIISLIAMIVFNALPETIYLEDYDGYNSITKSVMFLKENLINWGIPNLIFLLIFYSIFNSRHIFSQLNFKDMGSVIFSVVLILILALFMIYRGILFEELNGSSRRKREFMRNFDDD